MKNCLIVDDNYDIFAILQAAMSGHYHVDYAPDAFAALQLLSHKTYDILVSDIRMPHMSGLVFAEELKKKFKQIPIVFISGDVDQETVRKVFQLGGCNIVAKPFDMQELLDKMHRALAVEEAFNTRDSEHSEEVEQELGYVYNLLKIHYYEIQEILYQIQYHRIPMDVILKELDKKQRLGKCYFDDPENIKLLCRAA
ncbi:MAG: response regulator [Proteobacteria bacterium]|nr:MAG: response regulator [Pseudomonadota bacterium]